MTLNAILLYYDNNETISLTKEPGSDQKTARLTIFFKKLCGISSGFDPYDPCEKTFLKDKGKENIKSKNKDNESRIIKWSPVGSRKRGRIHEVDRGLMHRCREKFLI